MTARPAPRRRQPTEVRRAMVLEAVPALVAERGVRGTGIRDIAAAAGVSVGTLTYHFSGVREILAEALAAQLAAYYDPLRERAATLAPRDGLDLLLAASLDEETRPHWRLWLECWQDGVWDDERSQHERYTGWHAVLRDLVVAGVADGSLRCADPDGTAARLVALVDGLALQRLRGVPPMSSERAVAHVRTALADWTGSPRPTGE
ncbi:TetR/AcrR family transcriptional regulator [Pseudonocardia sp. ICBG601]|uniref:TetR/AcrR family transcriptional regulator n=1 Tax=Pseudonocardia sp. ICBG601 TaxID=2846759 RepID=UPI001CF6C763|nr:TetR family transcriptional regulator C-terminal domain-containing protein [Pseudonocardia sp. ICBG601]